MNAIGLQSPKLNNLIQLLDISLPQEKSHVNINSMQNSKNDAIEMKSKQILTPEKSSESKDTSFKKLLDDDTESFFEKQGSLKTKLFSPNEKVVKEFLCRLTNGLMVK